MKIKTEVFIARDVIDDARSMFMIHTVGGKDVGHNVMTCPTGEENEILVKRLLHLEEDGFLWTDSAACPRRADMIDPVKIYEMEWTK